MNKISGVYKITNTVTGDFYIGSSKNVKDRWRTHKNPSRWKKHPNSRMYQDMQKYCVDKFKFEIIEETTELKQREQYWMNLLKPKYNNYNAKGWDIERHKKTHKKYLQSEKGKKVHKKYLQSEKGREASNKAHKKYLHQLCVYNGEMLTLCVLSNRFQRAGIPHPVVEAKKYLCQVEKQ